MAVRVSRAKRAVLGAGELPRYRVPQHWGRQLGGTLKQQLEHLRIDAERNAMAAALPGKGLNNTDRKVLVALRLAGRALRPREIEEQINAGQSSVNATLQRLENCRLATRKDVPCPRGTKAFEWRAVV